MCNQRDFSWPSVEVCIENALEMCTGAGTGSVDVSELLGTGTVDCYEKQRALGPTCRTPPTVTEADVEAYRAACTIDEILPSPTKNLGEPCLVEYQCPRGAVCERPEKGCGTCVEVTEGKPCEHRRDCGVFAGFECNQSKVCSRYALLGESCETRSCDPIARLVCGADKKCTTFAKRDEDCSIRPCDEGLFLYCKQSTKKCTPLPRNAGDSCAEDKVCGSGLFCDYPTGKCVAFLAENEACTGFSSTKDPCDALAGLRCDPESGVCKSLYARAGEECGGTVYPPRPECWQSECKETEPGKPGTCVPYAQRGESCADRSCADYLLCSSGSKICQTVAEAGSSLDAGLGEYAACMPEP